MRLHEALKQCQDLKTEKGQMDRKINQLSEENGDLSFKVRGCTLLFCILVAVLSANSHWSKISSSLKNKSCVGSGHKVQFGFVLCGA